MKKFKSLLALASACSWAVSQAATNFYVDPTRIILQNTKNSVQLNIHNNATESQVIQAKVLMLTQVSKNNQLVESNPTIMGDPQILITPLVPNVKPQSTQPVRIMALSQLDNDEIAYRVVFSSVTRKTLTSSGTTFELGFAIPVYILPKNIVQNAQYTIKRQAKGNYQLMITNSGNVHLNLNKVVLLDNNNTTISRIDTPGVILSGKAKAFKFKLDKQYQSNSEFKAEIKAQDLINYNNEITKAIKITVS